MWKYYTTGNTAKKKNGQLEKQGTGMGTGMGNGNDNLCKKLHQQRWFRTLSLFSQIEPEISLTLACETMTTRDGSLNFVHR